MRPRYTNRSKMGGSKEQKMRARSTKSHRGIRKPEGQYVSLADRFHPSPKTKRVRAMTGIYKKNILHGSRVRRAPTRFTVSEIPFRKPTRRTRRKTGIPTKPLTPVQEDEEDELEKAMVKMNI